MHFKLILSRLANLSNSWLSEFRLIDDIWSGKHPENNMLELSFLEKLVMTILIFIRSLSLARVIALARSEKIQSQISESYVLVWLMALVLLLAFPISAIWYPLVIAYRIIDAFTYRLCIIFVDRYKKGWGLHSLNRSFMLLLINYMEMIVGFAALYIYTKSIAAPSGSAISDPWNAFYFSVVTITTLGYGDYSPICRTGQLLVIAQTLMGVIFVLVVISTFLTGVRDIRNLTNDKKAK